MSAVNLDADAKHALLEGILQDDVKVTRKATTDNVFFLVIENDEETLISFTITVERIETW